jgi:hypothetical protein
MLNLPHGLSLYSVNIKTMRKFAQIVVAFSERLNFKKEDALCSTLKISQF